MFDRSRLQGVVSGATAPWGAHAGGVASGFAGPVGGAGGGAVTPLQPGQQPPGCVQDEAHARQLDYTQRLYKNQTQSTRDHIIQRHIQPGVPGVSRYDPPADFAAVRSTNRETFVSGQPTFARGAWEFELPIPVAPGSVTGTDQHGNPARVNRLVVLPDCRTVVTSYPR
jgi:hypothetical protein